MQHSRFTEHEADANLKRDIGAVQACRASIQSNVGTFNDTRLLGIIAAGVDSDALLNGTLPLFIEKIRSTRKGIDLLLGLNDDAKAPAILDSIKSNDTKVFHLWSREKKHAGDAAHIYDNPELSDDAYTISNSEQYPTRVYAIHQKPSAYSTGQNPMLLDVYGLAIRSIQNGWKPPRHTLKFDAESHFCHQSALSGTASLDLNSNGIAGIMNRLAKHSQVGVIGTRTRRTVFEKVSGSPLPLEMPQFDIDVGPYQKEINLTHGMFGKPDWVSGAAYAAESATILAAGYEGLRALPGAKAEDFLTTSLARLATGRKHQTVPECVVTNRTYPATKLRQSVQQMGRWIAGVQDIVEYYGDGLQDRAGNNHWQKRLLLLLHDAKTFVEAMWHSSTLQQSIEWNRGDPKNGDPTWRS